MIRVADHGIGAGQDTAHECGRTGRFDHPPRCPARLGTRRLDDHRRLGRFVVVDAEPEHGHAPVGGEVVDRPDQLLELATSHVVGQSEVHDKVALRTDPCVTQGHSCRVAGRCRASEGVVAGELHASSHVFREHLDRTAVAASERNGCAHRSAHQIGFVFRARPDALPAPQYRHTARRQSEAYFDTRTQQTFGEGACEVSPAGKDRGIVPGDRGRVGSDTPP